MPDPDALQFTFNGEPLQLHITSQREPSTSLPTGRDLRRLRSEVRLSPQDTVRVKEFLGAESATDDDGVVWSGRVEVESFQYVDGVHSLQIEWSEVERLHAVAVEFEGLALVPTESHYSEPINADGSIAVNFRAVLNQEETRRLRALGVAKRSDRLYWPVVRRGVVEEARTMRLGRVLWQELDDETVAHDVTLVDESHDSSDAFIAWRPGEPQISNLISHMSRLLGQFDALVTEMEAAASLAPEAIQRVRSAAEAAGGARHYLFSQVSDLSEW